VIDPTPFSFFPSHLLCACLQTVKDLRELLTPDDNAIKELERENPYATLSLKHQMDPNDSFKRSVSSCLYHSLDSYTTCETHVWYSICVTILDM